MAPREETERILRAMGLTAEDFIEVRRATTVESRKCLLDALKTKAKKGYTRLAFELHPDRTGNDPEKTALFRTLVEVKADIDALDPDRFPAPEPSKPPVVVIVTQVRPPVRVTGYFRTAAQPPVTSINPNERARITANLTPSGVPRRIK